MSRQRVLIVGLGIGGMAAAIALRKAGWDTVIVERAPERRGGGYFIGLFPLGKEAATELGVFDHIHLRTAKGSKTWDVQGDGSRRHSPGFLDQPGAPDGVLRGDIEEGLWRGVEGNAEVRFDTIPVLIENDGKAVRVVLKTGATGVEAEERFDLVIGADGLRSTVRKLAFGPHERFMQPLGAMICAWQLDDQVPMFRRHDGIMLAEVNRAFWVFPLSDHSPTGLFTWRTDDVDAEFRKPPVDRLREVYAGMSAEGIVDEALRQLGGTDDHLFDSVAMVKMDRWHDGRIVLLGDAAWCLTLYSGMGATTAMEGGAELGKALAAHPGDIDAALAAWEVQMRPLIRKHRIGAHIKSEFFVPSSRPRAFLRGVMMRLGARKLVGQGKQAAVVPAGDGARA